MPFAPTEPHPLSLSFGRRGNGRGDLAPTNTNQKNKAGTWQRAPTDPSFNSLAEHELASGRPPLKGEVKENRSRKRLTKVRKAASLSWEGETSLGYEKNRFLFSRDFNPFWFKRLRRNHSRPPRPADHTGGDKCGGKWGYGFGGARDLCGKYNYRRKEYLGHQFKWSK